MNPLTCHLIVRDNQGTIERALASLMPLGCDLLAVDIGSKDDSYKICRRYGAEVIRLSLGHDYSKVRNEAVAHSKSEWQLYLEPWEVLAGGHELIVQALPMEKTAYQFNCVQGDILTKEIRLWNKRTGLRFENPIFETLPGQGRDLGAVVLVESMDRTVEASALLKTWKEEKPLAVEPYYYQACVTLMQRKWDTFLTTADHYLFHEKSPSALMPRTMTRYYRGVVQGFIKKDYRAAIRDIINCLAVRPLMAEFWCLLADIYYAQKEYEKALVFYDNAIKLGSRRLRNDQWPLEIPKYKDYPEKMIAGCRKVIANSRFILG